MEKYAQHMSKLKDFRQAQTDTKVSKKRYFGKTNQLFPLQIERGELQGLIQQMLN